MRTPPAGHRSPNRSVALAAGDSGAWTRPALARYPSPTSRHAQSRTQAFYQVPKTFDFTATSTTYDVWTVTVTEDEAWGWRPLNADFPQ